MRNNKHRKDFVLYYHRNMETNEIFYVGIGREKRAYFLHGRNDIWKKYVKKHGKPLIEIYKSSLTFLEAQYLEQRTIRILGRKKYNEGNLVNMTLGGEGTKGEAMSYKRRKAQSIALKGRSQTMDHIENRAATRRGKRMRQESIDKMAASLRGKKLPKTVKLKIGIKSKEMWQDADFREKAIAYRKGKIRNKRQVIDNNTAIVYESAKEAALAVGIKQSYFSGMMAGIFPNKSNCAYLEPRPFKNGKIKRYSECVIN